MALQGNLRDFSATEILQLLGSQKKTGRLTLESGGNKLVVYVHEGYIVSARSPGLTDGDPLLDFLKRIHRVSPDQALGLATLHQESGRDLETLLIQGRYLSADDLPGCIERQILDSLSGGLGWSDGTYQFDPEHVWEQTPAARLSMDGVLIEIARRVDEEGRYAKVFNDANMLLSVRDLPDPDQLIGEEATELFSLIDGRRTLSEIVEQSALTGFETRDALNRMLEANWIEIAGRRAGPALVVTAPVTPPPASGTPVERHSLLRELTLAAIIAAAVLAVRFESHFLQPPPPRPVASDVFAAAAMRDLRSALDLYRRERGSYPAKIEELVDDAWIAPGQTQLSGYMIQYLATRRGQDYRLSLIPDY